MKKIVFLLLIVSSGLLLTGCTQVPDSTGGNTTGNSSSSTSSPTSYTFTSESGRYTVELEYEDHTWTYIVSGDLPNPCYNFSVNSIIAESYPEQVTIRIIESVDTDLVCAQVITPKSLQGTISVSPDATFNLQTEEV